MRLLTTRSSYNEWCRCPTNQNNRSSIRESAQCQMITTSVYVSVSHTYTTQHSTRNKRYSESQEHVMKISLVRCHITSTAARPEWNALLENRRTKRNYSHQSGNPTWQKLTTVPLPQKRPRPNLSPSTCRN